MIGRGQSRKRARVDWWSSDLRDWTARRSRTHSRTEQPGRAMHLLTTSSANLDEIVEAVDLGQTPGDIVVLSFADSDLAALAAAWQAGRASLPSVRVAPL